MSVEETRLTIVKEFYEYHKGLVAGFDPARTGLNNGLLIIAAAVLVLAGEINKGVLCWPGEV